MVRPIKAWAVVKNKIEILELYDTQDVEIRKGERLIRVKIIPDEENSRKARKRTSK